MLFASYFMNIKFISINDSPEQVIIDNRTNNFFIVMLKNHFLTMNVLRSTLEGYCIYIFDSTLRTRDKTEQLFKIIVGRIIPETRHVKFSWESMQLQNNNTACGLFAVAVVTALYRGVNPSSMRWNQEAMLGHFRQYIRRNVVFDFQLSEYPNSITMSERDFVSLNICANCKRPYSKFQLSTMVTAIKSRLRGAPDLLMYFNRVDICEGT